MAAKKKRPGGKAGYSIVRLRKSGDRCFSNKTGKMVKSRNCPNIKSRVKTAAKRRRKKR